MNEIRIEAAMSRTKPDLRPLARHFMERILAFYEDPENEREFQEWKAAREAQKGA